MKLKYTYDKSSDSLYLKVGRCKWIENTEPLESDKNVILDYNDNGMLCGIEILGFKKRFK